MSNTPEFKVTLTDKQRDTIWQALVAADEIELAKMFYKHVTFPAIPAFDAAEYRRVGGAFCCLRMSEEEIKEVNRQVNCHASEQMSRCLVGMLFCGVGYVGWGLLYVLPVAGLIVCGVFLLGIAWVAYCYRNANQRYARNQQIAHGYYWPKIQQANREHADAIYEAIRNIASK